MARTRTVALGIDLFVANRALEAAAYDAVVGAGYDDLTPSQARLLARVAEEGSRLGELADRARVTKQTAGHLVDQLERAGYVTRTPDPTDGRARLVRLTARAYDVVPVANRAVRELLDEWEDRLGPEDMGHLVRIMARLGGMTDPFRS